MPAVSKSQQRLMGQAYALKKGDLKPEDLNPEYRDQIEDLANGMTLKQLKDYAETSHEDLPKKVKESRYIPSFEEFISEESITKNDQEEMINESGVIRTANNIHQDLSNFLTTVVVPKSRGYVNNERDAALLLIDIIKHQYNIK
jgi:hypothetical protein